MWCLPSLIQTTEASSLIIKTITEFHTLKYHVSCTDGKISVRINLLFYLFFNVVPSNTYVFLSCRPFVVNTTFSTSLEVFSVSWLWQLIIVIVGFQNFVCCLVWAVLSWSSNHCVGRSLYIGSSCPAMTSLSKCLEEAAFSISISSSVFIFLWFAFKVYYGHSFLKTTTVATVCMQSHAIFVYTTPKVLKIFHKCHYYSLLLGLSQVFIHYCLPVKVGGPEFFYLLSKFHQEV